MSHGRSPVEAEMLKAGSLIVALVKPDAFSDNFRGTEINYVVAYASQFKGKSR